MFKNSEILPHLIQFIQNYYQIFEDFCVIILEVLNHVHQRQEICEQICQLGFLRDLLFIIYEKKNDYKSYFSRLSFEILWNYIYMMGKEAIKTIEIDYSLMIVKDIFCVVINKGYKMEDKTFRNELLVLMNHLLASEEVLESALKEPSGGLLEKIPMVNLQQESLEQYGFLEILLYLGTLDEVIDFQKDSKLESRKYFEIGYEDLMCKKLILHLLTLAIKNGGQKIQSLIQKSYFIESLFYYFKLYNGDSLSFQSRYSIPQIKEIQ